MYTSPLSRSHDVRVRIAYNLRRCREACGFSQQAAAHEYGDGMHATVISKYENAYLRPTDERLARFGEIYGVDIQAFYGPLPQDGAA